MPLRPLVIALALACSLGVLGPARAQGPAADTWSNVPQASDDRFTNPKSKFYAGPNGWYNSGEVRAGTDNAGAGGYAFKGGLRYLSTPEAFVLVDEKKQTRLLSLDFGAEKPAAGDYQLATKADAAQKKVAVSLTDMSDGKILEWSGPAAGGGRAGVVTVSVVHGYLYFRARGLRLAPAGTGHTGDLKQPLSVGVEGAVAPE